MKSAEFEIGEIIPQQKESLKTQNKVVDEGEDFWIRVDHRVGSFSVAVRKIRAESVTLDPRWLRSRDGGGKRRIDLGLGEQVFLYLPKADDGRNWRVSLLGINQDVDHSTVA